MSSPSPSKKIPPRVNGSQRMPPGLMGEARKSTLRTTPSRHDDTIMRHMAVLSIASRRLLFLSVIAGLITVGSSSGLFSSSSGNHPFGFPRLNPLTGVVLPRKSCLEHYLNGESKAGIKPLLAVNGDDDGEDVGPFNVECVPPEQGESDQLVGTKVHNALEQWHKVQAGEKHTIGYQINHRPTLRHLLQSSEFCSQDVFVRWPRLNLQNEESETQLMAFTLESVQGAKRVFQRNFSTYEPYEEALTFQSIRDSTTFEVGVLHVIGTDEGYPNATAWVRTGPLICSEKVVDKVECLFELNTRSDWLKVSAETQGLIQFSFRTDKPTTPFLKIFLSDGSSVNVELHDGYLISIDHTIHAMKHLADGHWHTIAIDVKGLTLQVDGASPLISLSAVTNKVTDVHIILNGQVSAIQAGVKPGNWLCAGHAHIESQLTEQILRKICPSYEANYCQCKAPLSVLSRRPLCGNTVDERRGFQLARKSDKLAFFFVPTFSEKSRLYIVFKTDSPSGLVFFGISKSTESSTRVQVHFNADRIFASQCTKSADHSEKCRSCSLRKSGGFATNSWIHVSFFHYGNYQFLAVDSTVCQLSLDIAATASSASSEFHDGTALYEADSGAPSGLFIGGTYYAKTKRVGSKVISSFRKNYLDNTREKPPSLHGCIAEIILNGEVQNLEAVFKAQLVEVAKEGSPEVFAMQSGCQGCKVSTDLCAGATCRSPAPALNEPPICDCASIFALQDESTGQCYTDISASEVGATGGYGNLILTSDQKVILDKMTFKNSGKAILDKIWILLRFPDANTEPETIIEIGEIKIETAENGHRVIIKIDTFTEEFQVETSDERLHLIAIQRNPTMGTTSLPTVKVQVDNAIKYIDLEELPIVGTQTVIVTPITHVDEEGKAPGVAGCIAEFAATFEYREDVAKIYPENRVHQEDLLKELVSHAFSGGVPAEIGLVSKGSCGIRDPSLWTANSTGYGIVGEYDPYGKSESNCWSIVLTVILVLVVLGVLIGYCYFKQRKSATYKMKPTTVSKEEKTPLRDGYLDQSGSSTDHSHVDLSSEKTPPAEKKNGTYPATKVNVRDPLSALV
uniref:LAM_G_DOMAIN domain-containing protein n=1 Tax=Panagrellus redivivus TaxID=6233 RepID=A0A7E4ZVT7_PANRE